MDFLHNFATGLAIPFIVGYKGFILLFAVTIIMGILRRARKHGQIERVSDTRAGQRDMQQEHKYAPTRVPVKETDRYTITRRNLADRQAITRIVDEHRGISQNR